MFKLGMCAEKKWQGLRGYDTQAKVITEVKFKDGVEEIGDNQVTDEFIMRNTRFDNNSAFRY